MSANLVLDSSAWIELERGNQKVQEILLQGFNVLLPAIVLAELQFAVASQPTQTKAKQSSLRFLELVKSTTEFVAMDELVVEKLVELQAYCKRIGKPRTISDLSIAATALVKNAFLISFDQKAAFNQLPNLKTI